MQELLAHLKAHPDVQSLLTGVAQAPVLETAIAVQQVPAPTFHEYERAQAIKRHMLAAGLDDVDLITHQTGEGDVYNVYGRRPGADPSRPALVLSAHTDTVFDADTDLSVTHRPDEGRVYGPGLGDNSTGVAALLVLAAQMHAAGYRPPCDVWFVANAREEGLGNLGGIRAALEHLRDCIGAVIVVEGMVLGWVYHAGIAVRRYKVALNGPGGHSWGSFGQPSAVHELMRLGARIAELTVPEKPRTTFNIGMVEGGSTINTIASDAAMYLDLRAETKAGVEALERQALDLVYTVPVEGVEAAVTLVGSRPTGRISHTHWLVRAGVEALEDAGIRASYAAGSTDVNAVLAAGLPGITVGITRGGNSHRQDEYIQPTPIKQGMHQCWRRTS
jgi:acetylornithine deacetylase/succinyl-diaminopimelate desuccinylase-like protein